jgi:DNA-binding NarL/FixJ family response regulator
MTDQIRVLLAEGQPIYRAGLRYILEKDAAILVSGEARSGKEALRLALEMMSDVLVLDMQLPQISGFEIVQTLRMRQVALPILALSRYDDETYLTRIVTSNVNGCLLKTEDPALVVEAVHELASHSEYWWSAGVSKRLLTRNTLQAFARSPAGLSQREIQILRLMALGHTNRHIANTLCLSLGTVKNYISGIYAKLQVDTRAKAVSWVWQRGLFEGEKNRESIECG